MATLAQQAKTSITNHLKQNGMSAVVHVSKHKTATGARIFVTFPKDSTKPLEERKELQEEFNSQLNPHGITVIVQKSLF